MRLVFLFLICLFSVPGDHFLRSEDPPSRRVLFIITKLSMGGAEQAFVSMINGWSMPNTTVEMLIRGRGGALEGNLRKDFLIISTKAALERSYDVAVCYGEWMNPKRVLCKVNAQRKVQWIHTDLAMISYASPFKKAESYSGIDALVCVSEKVAESVRKIQPLVADKVFAIRNTLDADLIRRKARQEGPYLPQDGICNVVSVARLCHEKAFDRAIRVHERLEKEGIHFRWYIVGEGLCRRKLEQQIKACGLEGKFVLLGQKMNPYPYILQADVFAMPSLVEGWCLAVTEAKVLARPILFTDVAGAREQIESEFNGLIVENSEEGIYTGLKRLLLDKSLRNKFSDALKGFEYDNASIYRDIEHLFFPDEIVEK